MFYIISLCSILLVNDLYYYFWIQSNFQTALHSPT